MSEAEAAFIIVSLKLTYEGLRDQIHTKSHVFHRHLSYLLSATHFKDQVALVTKQ